MIRESSTINMAIGKYDIDQLPAVVSLIETYRQPQGWEHICNF